MKKFNVAIIGLGRISPLHIDAIMHLDNVCFFACCDIDKEKANKIAKEYGCKAYYDYKEMIDNEKLDAIHICLPHYLHTIVSNYALEHGINVLVEKPMAIDYEEAVNTVNLARSKNLTYSVVMQCRFNDATTFVRNAIDSGKLGNIISIRSILTWGKNKDYYLDDWHGKWKTEGGGVIINQAVHSIDLVNWIVNSTPIKIECSLKNHNHDYIEVEDSAEGFIQYENGIKYLFYASTNYGNTAPIEISILCELGKVEFSYTDATITYNNGKIKKYKDKVVKNKANVSYWCNKHYAQIKNFYNAIDGKEKLLIDGNEALKTESLICQIYKKGKENY